MLARLFLLRGGYALSGLVSLDAYLDQQRREYFAAIRDTIGRHYERGYDATPFVRYFLQAIAGAAEHVLERIKGLRQVLSALRAEVTRGAFRPPLLEGLVYAWINGSVRPADYIRITGRTDNSTSRDLALAATLGYLMPVGRTRSRRYTSGPKLEAIGAIPVTSLRAPGARRSSRVSPTRRSRRRRLR